MFTSYFGENSALSKHDNAIMRSNAKCDQQIHLWTDSSPDRELRNQGFHSVVCTLGQCENLSCLLCPPQEFAQPERPGHVEHPPDARNESDHKIQCKEEMTF